MIKLLYHLLNVSELFLLFIFENFYYNICLCFFFLLIVSGEGVKYLGHTDDGVLALTNYRLFLLKNSTSSETSVPLGLIETSQVRDLFHLLISCKDASTVK